MSQGRPAVYQWCGYRALLVGSSSCARQFSFGGQKLDTIRVQEGPSRLEHGREQPIHSTHQSVGSRRRRRSGLFGRESLRGVEHPRLVPQVQGVRGSNPLSSTESRVEFPRYRGILRASRMSSVAASQSPLAPPNLFLHLHGRWNLGSHATPWLVAAFESSCSRTSAGVLKSWRLRGLELSSAAMLSSIPGP